MEWGFAHDFKNSEWKWNLPTSFFATQNGKGNLPISFSTANGMGIFHKQISHELFTCPSNFEFIILSTWERG